MSVRRYVAKRKGKRTAKQKRVDMMNREGSFMLVENTRDLPRDKKRDARQAGWRVSKSGNIYFENRSNRSDTAGQDF